MSSGQRKVHRLSRRGNRRLNHAIHMAAITQVSHRHSQGRAYYDKKLAEGKTPKEALRALKRQVSNAIFACLQADARRAAARSGDPGGQQGNGSVASAAGLHPRYRLFGQATPGPATTLRRQPAAQHPATHATGKRPTEPLDAKRHSFCMISSLLSRLALTAQMRSICAQAHPAGRQPLRRRSLKRLQLLSLCAEPRCSVLASHAGRTRQGSAASAVRAGPRNLQNPVPKSERGTVASTCCW